MRHFAVVLLILFIFFPFATKSYATDDKQSIIIEVDGNPSEHRDYIETYHPFVEVVATYDQLFAGLALQATPKNLAKLSSADFIKAIHPVQTYETSFQYDSYKDFQQKELADVVFPADINKTPYTGKGVKVAVIDTGIDYTHPDLALNYAGGYDLVDLDDDPMETKPSEGAPTAHGTHVAGIIAANGNITGVAPDAHLYAYRALGPGGQGTSVQIIAAMEQAVMDGVDIINLSLGNNINGPDFPTSMAVNKAKELGVAVVIANGNSGPEEWTVGSPATATNAFAVGAIRNEQLIPYLRDDLANENIELNMMFGSKPWDLQTDYELIDMDNTNKSLTGKIAIAERSDTSFYEIAKQAEEQRATALLIYNNQEESFHGSVEHDTDSIDIPVASVTKSDGTWLLEQMDAKSYYLSTTYEKMSSGIAPFSSRGPVINSWEIKPEILAPGTNVFSTVPNGYASLEGTSMAAPHVAGAIAVIKEANPNWTNDQIINSLKTTAQRLTTDEDEVVNPITQGMGELQISQAIDTTTLIDQSLLSFGKLTDFKETKTVNITIENLASDKKIFTFDIPKKQTGISWSLPQTFTIEGNEKKTVPIELHVTPSLIDEGMNQGWLTLSEQNEKYELPYLFVNQTADYPKAMGFDFDLMPFSDDTYEYQVYVTEPIVRMDVQLFHPETLFYDRTFLHLNDLDIGMNKGELDKSEIGEPGLYQAIITVQLENGDYESYEIEIYIEN